MAMVISHRSGLTRCVKEQYVIYMVFLKLQVSVNKIVIIIYDIYIIIYNKTAMWHACSHLIFRTIGKKGHSVA